MHPTSLSISEERNGGDMACAGKFDYDESGKGFATK